jgi:hypothetical protein
MPPPGAGPMLGSLGPMGLPAMGLGALPGMPGLQPPNLPGMGLGMPQVPGMPLGEERHGLLVWEVGYQGVHTSGMLRGMFDATGRTVRVPLVGPEGSMYSPGQLAQPAHTQADICLCSCCCSDYLALHSRLQVKA